MTFVLCDSIKKLILANANALLWKFCAYIMTPENIMQWLARTQTYMFTDQISHLLHFSISISILVMMFTPFLLDRLMFSDPKIDVVLVPVLETGLRCFYLFCTAL